LLCSGTTTSVYVWSLDAVVGCPEGAVVGAAAVAGALVAGALVGETLVATGAFVGGALVGTCPELADGAGVLAPPQPARSTTSSAPIRTFLRLPESNTCILFSGFPS
jgi:hypothetical protein